VRLVNSNHQFDPQNYGWLIHAPGPTVQAVGTEGVKTMLLAQSLSQRVVVASRSGDFSHAMHIGSEVVRAVTSAIVDSIWPTHLQDEKPRPQQTALGPGVSYDKEALCSRMQWW